MKKDLENTLQKRNFLEEHPRLNVLLTIVLFVILILAAVCTVQYIGNQVKECFNWLQTTVSKLDAVIIVALITGAVSVFSVVFNSIISKLIEYKKNRQDYLTQKREIPYGEFVNMIYRLRENTKNDRAYTQEEMLDDISKFSKQLTLWGSHRVIDMWVQYRENATNPDAAKENLFLMEDILNEMRHDLGLKKVKKGSLLAFFINDIKASMRGMRKKR